MYRLYYVSEFSMQNQNQKHPSLSHFVITRHDKDVEEDILLQRERDVV